MFENNNIAFFMLRLEFQEGIWTCPSRVIYDPVLTNQRYNGTWIIRLLEKKLALIEYAYIKYIDHNEFRYFKKLRTFL
jgi:hypothetical protein